MTHDLTVNEQSATLHRIALKLLTLFILRLENEINKKNTAITARKLRNIHQFIQIVVTFPNDNKTNSTQITTQ